MISICVNQDQQLNCIRNIDRQAEAGQENSS